MKVLFLTASLLLLLFTQVVEAVPASKKASFLQDELASSPQETCAECYEFESDIACDPSIQATDKSGNLLWAAHYNAFGRASIITPAATADKPTIQVNLRLPGQYEDAESGLHYNYRRFYDPDTGRYWTQDPHDQIQGLEGGINLFSYAQADPINLTDPTGEIVPVVVAGAVCMASCMAATAAEDLITGECTTVGTSAKNCAIGCAMGGVGALGMKVGKWAKRAFSGGCNSFAADTLVHIQPPEATAPSAKSGNAQLKRIQDLQPGDKVLAFSEWKEQGSEKGQDKRLSYEPITDIFTSYKAQTHVFITLDNGQTLQATEGHPFLTSEGWRDAILLKKGGKLLIKGEAEADTDAGKEVFNKAIYKENQPVAVINTAQSATENIVKTTLSSDANQAAGSYRTILDIRTERQTVPVFNIEVANAHTFFVGDEGVLVHNGRCTPSMRRAWEKLHNKVWPKNPMTEKIRPGGNQDGHHINPVSKGGHKTDPANITPMTPSDHIKHHQTHGYK
jgi:RHS repeat-associated protein